MILAYHIYLAFLVATAERAAVSLTFGQTIITHLAFLVVVVGLPYLRDQIPFFNVVSFFIPALAPFEADWLFSKERKLIRKKDRQKVLSWQAEQLLYTATAEDYEAFLQYMRHPERRFRKDGRGIREEYALWLADRAKKKRVTTR